MTLGQEANSVHAIPGGNVSGLKRELSTLEKALFCCSKKTVGKKDFRFPVRVRFLQKVK